MFGLTSKLPASSRWAMVPVAIACAGVFAGCASGATAKPPPATTADVKSAANTALAKPVVLTVVQSKWLAPGVSHLGDTVAQFLKATDDDGRTVGYNAFTCTVVATGSPSDKMQCEGSLVLRDGSVESNGVVDRTNLETPGASFDAAVTSGTGAYRRLQGDIRWTQLPPDGNGASRARGVFTPA